MSRPFRHCRNSSNSDNMETRLDSVETAKTVSQTLSRHCLSCRHTVWVCLDTVVLAIYELVSTHSELSWQCLCLSSSDIVRTFQAVLKQAQTLSRHFRLCHDKLRHFQDISDCAETSSDIVNTFQTIIRQAQTLSRYLKLCRDKLRNCQDSPDCTETSLDIVKTVQIVPRSAYID
jgi:hypothetical protein